MINLEKLTFPELLRRSLYLYSERPALGWVGGTHLSYQELGERISAFRFFLSDSGIGVGDRVALLSENQPNWGAAFFAITSLGAIVVPVMVDFKNEQVRHIFNHAGVKIIFVSEKQLERINREKDLAPKLIRLEDFSVKRESGFSLTDFNSSRVSENDTAVIMYTSGTMGRLKGVVLSHKNIISNARASIKCASLTPAYHTLSILPLAHMIELTLGLVAPVMGGASIYYLRGEFDENVLLAAFKKVRPTLIVAVPLLIEKIYRNKILYNFTRNNFIKKVYSIPAFRRILNLAAGYKLKRVFGGKLKLFSMGGAGLDAEVEKFLREARFPYALGYGLTEAAPLLAGPETAERYWETPLGSSGRNLTGVEIKIFSPDKDGVGEILARGDNITRGYYQEEELTRELFTSDGWLKTGDLGRIDKNGFLFVKGRLKNVIIRSDGRNIYPEEIESILNRQEYIDKSIVYEKNGQIIAEVNLNLELIKSAREEKGFQEIMEAARLRVNQQLPTFARINKIIKKDEPFILTPTKKIKRFTSEEKIGKISAIEGLIKNICAEILNKKELDANASFYDLGADSLDIIRFFQKLKENFPGKITLPDIFANSTIARLAKFLEKNK